ncbi:TPA: hypothetical protein ACQJWO_005601, partial [Klebsiella pneumoniae]
MLMRLYLAVAIGHLLQCQIQSKAHAMIEKPFIYNDLTESHVNFTAPSASLCRSPASAEPGLATLLTVRNDNGRPKPSVELPPHHHLA